ncbi:MAG: PEGA domain-containing protein [Ignavibacteriae bacterium]|nr:PEGA domain-containing protein [Ignavibacteriota bacterium]
MKFSFIKLSLVIISTFIIINSCVEDHVMPNLGNVFITSDPTGAKIFIDDEDQSKVTPDSLNNLLEGEYKITLKLNEYKDTVFYINVSNQSNISSNIYLYESNPKGKIILTSSPTNAQIFLNNVNIGEFTPDTLENLERGNYNIKLKLDLYDDYDLPITLTKDQTITRNLQMNIAGTSSGLIVESSPSGASIEINGENTTFVTPKTFKPLKAGNYDITLSLLNYRDTTVSINVLAGETKTASVNLTLYEPRGSITLSSNPSNALIYLDGTNTELTTPNKLRKLEAGQYDITLKLLGYYDSTFSVIVEEDLNTTVPIVNLTPLPEIGDFKINSDPKGASIYINDVITGLTTPQTFEKLLVQEYSVTLKLKDFADTTITFNLIKDNLIDLGTVFLRDIVPAVDVIIDYLINDNQQLVFSFVFNQDIRLDKVDVTFPNGSNQTSNYNNQLIPKDRKIDWVYAEKITGTWIFNFSGNKVGGRQIEFEFSEQMNVQ